MYRHIEKDEKKLTDEEIVKALECCANFSTQKDCDLCPIGVIKCFEQENLMPQLALDLIHRLQAEIERLTSLYECQTAFMTSSIGDLPLTVEGLRKAVDEISRLLTVQGELQDLNVEYYNEAKDLRRENTELQKQVEMLDLENYKLEKQIADLKIEHKEQTNGLLRKLSIMERCEDCLAVSQAAKATAEEIYAQVLEWSPVGENYHWFITTLENWLKEKYGVEVE